MDRLHRFALAAVAAACGSTLLIAASPSPAAPAAERNADPYTLPVDPVSGERLGKNAIVREYDGREVRFASERTAERFEADLKANLATLDERMIEDQAAFYPMQVCLVAKHPPKEGEAWTDVVYRNRLVRFCCAGCEFKLEKQPEKYLADLDAAVIEQQREAYPLQKCLVGGGALGSMGEPHEVVLANRLVRLCCDSCEETLRENAPQLIAELDAAWRKQDPQRFAASEPAPAAE